MSAAVEFEAGWWDLLPLSGQVEVLDLNKAVVPKSKRRAGDSFCGYVGGWLNTPAAEDRQGDEIADGAFDFKPFLFDGWYNDNHSRDILARFGYPVIAEPREHPEFGPSFWTEGPIVDTPRSQELMAWLRQLKDTDRQFGFSVEGPPPQRDPLNHKRIVKAAVYNAAITDRPVNVGSRITLVKALGALPFEGVEALLAYGEHDPEGARNLMGLLKGLVAGAPAGNTATGGAALQRESMERKVVNATFTAEPEPPAEDPTPEPPGLTAKSFESALPALVESLVRKHGSRGATPARVEKALRRAARTFLKGD